MRQSKLALPEFLFVHEHHRSALGPQSASLASSRKWHHGPPRCCGQSLLSVISDWLLSFLHDLTANQVLPSEASDKDTVEQTQAIYTLPCLNSSSTECLSMIQRSLYHDTKWQSGRRPEPIPIIHSSFQDTSYFISIFVFHIPVHFNFFHCLFLPHHSVFYISF